MIKTVMIDLDGTLLPFVQDEFVKLPPRQSRKGRLGRNKGDDYERRLAHQLRGVLGVFPPREHGLARNSAALR